jgi:hypothetical protein
VLICTTAALSIIRAAQGERLGFTPPRIGTAALGGLLALYVFMADSLKALLARVASKENVTEGVTLPQRKVLPSQLPKLGQVFVNPLSQEHRIKGEVQLA